jgi:Niemann-Pick C2 protein
MFTDVSSNEVGARAYWVGTMGTLPWVGMETNACLSTSCPVQAGVRQTYNYTLKISKKYSAVSVQLEQYFNVYLT